MIFSDKQHVVSRAQVSKLKAALLAIEKSDTIEDWAKQAEADAIKSQISEIESEIIEYELLKSGRLAFSKTYTLEDLPRVLVQARIASGLSQTDLATKLGMKPQQIQRYEATHYMGANLSRLIEVSRTLGVKNSGIFQGEKDASGSMFIWRDADDLVWGQFPYKEMIKRKWFNVPRGANPIEKVKEYFFQAAGAQFATAYHRKKSRSENAPNEYALLAWQARVLDRSRALSRQHEIGEFKLDDSWMPELVSLARYEDGAKRAGQFLAQKGITLIVEPHLPGSYLDGAAMLDEADRPIIGLTLRYDRLDNFWFVLMHELGHVFLHLFEGLHIDFFDDESAPNSDVIESEADKYALDALIPEQLWNQCLSRFALSDEAVRIDAKNIGIHPSIIAGRIRKERGNYTILNDLVGQGHVRSQFEEAADDLD